MSDLLLLVAGLGVLLARWRHFPLDVEASLLASFAAALLLRVALALDAARPVLAFIAKHGPWGLRVVVRGYAEGLRRWLARRRG